MRIMWFKFKETIIRLLAWITGGDAVYVKTSPRDIYLKIARKPIDPFSPADLPLYVKFSRIYDRRPAMVQLIPSGEVIIVFGSEAVRKPQNVWKYISKSKEVERILKNQT